MRPPNSNVVVALALLVGSAAQESTPPKRLENVVELAGEVIDRPVEAALGWMKFLAAGYRNPADHLGNGEAADAELALGGAIESSLKTFVATLPGKKAKVRLNDAIEGPITKVDEGGIAVTVNKADVLVTWAEVDPAKLALQMVKAKPTAEPDLATIAVLKMLGGDLVDAKKQSGKLTGELGKKLQELLDDWKAVGPEVAAARSLDAILKERDAAKATERFKAGWAAIGATRLGAAVAANARTQFLLRAEVAFAGDVGLKAAIHGKITTNPARAHPSAGPGGVGIEVEYEFEKDVEGPDFDPGAVNKVLRGILKNSAGGREVEPKTFQVTQSRLTVGEPCGGPLPLQFGGDLELELQGGLLETTRDPKVGFLGAGFTTGDGAQVILLQNFAAIDVISDGKGGASMEKRIEKLEPGSAFAVTLRLAGGKLSFTRNGEKFEPALNVTPAGMLQPFVIGGAGCQWFVERFVVRGTATKASLDGLGRALAEREAKALFRG